MKRIVLKVIIFAKPYAEACEAIIAEAGLAIYEWFKDHDFATKKMN